MQYVAGSDAAHEVGESTSAKRRRHGAVSTRGERRRESLLDSAEELLSVSAASELTIDAVAAASGLSRSSVYFYFANKTELVDALIARASDEMLERTTARGYGESLAAFVERQVLSALDGWRQHRAVFLAAAEVSSHANEGTSRWRSIMSDFTARLAEATRHDLPGSGTQVDRKVLLIAELACWAIERNFYMLFAREHDEAEEQELAQALIESTLAMLGTLARA